MSALEKRIRITSERIASFERSLAAARSRECSEDVHPLLWKAHLEGMESMLSTLRRELSELEEAGRA